MAAALALACSHPFPIRSAAPGGGPPLVGLRLLSAASFNKALDRLEKTARMLVPFPSAERV